MESTQVFSPKQTKKRAKASRKKKVTKILKKIIEKGFPSTTMADAFARAKGSSTPKKKK